MRVIECIDGGDDWFRWYLLPPKPLPLAELRDRLRIASDDIPVYLDLSSFACTKNSMHLFEGGAIRSHSKDGGPA